jgi:hypothetical protein
MATASRIVGFEFDDESAIIEREGQRYRTHKFVGGEQPIFGVGQGE